VLGRPSDMRLADLNGDGCLDVITQGYGKNDASSDTRALLHLNDGTGRFDKDNAFFQKNIRGAGEGVLVADFNGDSFLDVYLPYYTLNCSPISNYPNVCPTSAQHYLMTNDGRGVFKDTAYASGVALPFPAGSQPEGTQAIDINDDGKIDFYSSGRLFINIGNDGFNAPRFQDCNCGLPTAPVHPATELRADEGAKFLDWNNDGLLDLVIHHWNTGPVLYVNEGTRVSPKFRRLDYFSGSSSRAMFSEAALPYARPFFENSFGVNAYDLDNDGFEDVVTSGSGSTQSAHTMYFFRNTGLGKV
jgi:hypothetical protein